MTGPGCINFADGKTAGIRSVTDPVHVRNYGACMCARRADLIAVGGADEHIDYLGHVCGPYDMTFRLINFGRREVWDEDEFMYHTWHPGQAGTFDYMGPHDGRQLSTPRPRRSPPAASRRWWRTAPSRGSARPHPRRRWRSSIS